MRLFHLFLQAQLLEVDSSNLAQARGDMPLNADASCPRPIIDHGLQEREKRRLPSSKFRGCYFLPRSSIEPLLLRAGIPIPGWRGCASKTCSSKLPLERRHGLYIAKGNHVHPPLTRTVRQLRLRKTLQPSRRLSTSPSSSKITSRPSFSPSSQPRPSPRSSHFCLPPFSPAISRR